MENKEKMIHTATKNNVNDYKLVARVVVLCYNKSTGKPTHSRVFFLHLKEKVVSLCNLLIKKIYHERWFL